MMKSNKVIDKRNSHRPAGIRHPVSGIILLVFCPLALCAQEAPLTLTLSNCVEMALTRSLPLANAMRQKGIADATVKQVKAQVYPALDAEAGYTRLDEVPLFAGIPEPQGRYDNYAASLNLDQLLYSGGAVHAALDAARYFREVATYDIDRQHHTIIRDVTSVFYEILLAEAEVDVRRMSVEQLESFEEQIRIKHEYRTASEYEWLSAQVKLANERPLYVMARNKLSLARTAMRNLLYLDNHDFVLEGSLDSTPQDYELQQLYALGLEQRPEMNQAQSQIELADADLRVARSDYYPEVRAFGLYEGKNPGNQEQPAAAEWDWGWQLGVRATWSVLDGGLRKGKVAEKTLEKAIAEANFSELKRQITREIEDAYLRLQDAEEVMQSSSENIRLAEKALDIAQVRYDEGLITYLELSDGNLTLNNARFTHYRALAAWQQALADLRYACGMKDMKEDMAP